MEQNMKNRLAAEWKTFEKAVGGEERIPNLISPEDLMNLPTSTILWRMHAFLHEIAEEIGQAALWADIRAEKEEELEEEGFGDEFEEAFWGDPDVLVFVAHPEGDNSLIRMSEFGAELDDLMEDDEGEYDLIHVPGTDNLYYTFYEKEPIRRKGRTIYMSPAVIFGIDDEKDVLVNPSMEDLYTAGRFFDDAMTTVKNKEGKKVPAFCFEEGGSK